jgi:hypothetical protein
LSTLEITSRVIATRSTAATAIDAATATGFETATLQLQLRVL